MVEIETYRHKRASSSRTTLPRAGGSTTPNPTLPNKPMGVAAPPVAQVAPVPRGIAEAPPTNNLVPVRPQATITPPTAFFEASPPPVVNIVAGQPIPVQPLAVQVHYGHDPFLPIMEDHLEELNRHIPSNVDQHRAQVDHIEHSALATKSLSALKSRKEQIKDKLEDMVGRDEMERLTMISQERATTGKSAGALAMAIGLSPSNDNSLYSMWTTRSVATLTVATSGAHQSLYSSGSSDYYFPMEDELIPFSDTPQVSRFGPISRRGATIMHPTKPSQTLAPMDDEPMPTAVVRHSKQMAAQAPQVVPPTASLIMQNGSRTALQPVAVGANGEIGYIAIQEQLPQPTMIVAAGN